MGRPADLLRLYLERIVTLAFFSAMAWLAMAIADLSMSRLRTRLESRHGALSRSVLPLASRFLKIAILLLTIAAIPGSWGYNANTILAGLGVGGVAIAPAAQKTIENLLGGVALITDRPLAAGDFCKFGDVAGTAEDVGLRSTRIRTLNRTVVTVPNGEVSAMTLENSSKRDKMWFHITLNLGRDTRHAGLVDSAGSEVSPLQNEAFYCLRHPFSVRVLVRDVKSRH
jgi:MscS family membrane protein